MLNDFNPVSADTPISVKNQVASGPIPDWVKAVPFDLQFKSEDLVPITFLLFDDQVHAEKHESFVRRVVRLETMDAVQHWSQWRLQFEPKTQLVTLHTLKIRRGDVEIDQLNLGKAHFLQREEGLEKFIIHGWFTLLIILEDVRPGDILEFAYTIQIQSSLFQDHGSYFFSLPQGLSVGKYHFAVQFNTARQRKWKSSAADLIPVEIRDSEMMFWEWSKEKYVALKPEMNTPTWYISHMWIQVSDFPDWQTVAAGFAKAWLAKDGDGSIAELGGEIASKETDLPSRIEKAIRLVQDDCRYLSVNLELGGQVPTPPETVLRRRFGDCKDLSFLLTGLLRELGVEARPVLVNAFLRKTVGDFLPTPSLFNHVVVEFEAEGKKRWIDTTLKHQGGGAFNRVVTSYGLGLPVDANAANLIAPPQIPGQSNLFELRESILLDTNDAPSLMAITLRSEGNQAEILRGQLTATGLEEMAKQRLQAITNRFGNAKRVGSLQYRDDRAANQFILAEVFEIKFLLAPHPNANLCRFSMPGNWLASVLLLPEKAARKTPFALPYPCQIVYALDVDSAAIFKMNVKDPRSYLGNQFIGFNRNDRAGHGFVLMNISLDTRADCVPPDQIEKYCELVEQIRRESCRELSIKKGYSRSRPKMAFGQLPSPPVKLQTPLLVPSANSKQVSPPSIASPHSSTRAGERYKMHNPVKIPSWLKVVGTIFILFWLFFIVLLLIKHHP